MITLEKCIEVKEEAQRFIKAIEKLEAIANRRGDTFTDYDNPKEKGIIKARSMILSKMLVELRK